MVGTPDGDKMQEDLARQQLGTGVPSREAVEDALAARGIAVSAAVGLEGDPDPAIGPYGIPVVQDTRTSCGDGRRGGS